MKTISVKTRYQGIDYEIIFRRGRKCIICAYVTPDLPYFEVAILRVLKEKEIYSVHYRKREQFPKDEDFGKTAWSYRFIEDAIKRYNRIKGPKMKNEVIADLIEKYGNKKI
jgi:hypothetical protein